jgi:hypothetical protein
LTHSASELILAGVVNAEFRCGTIVDGVDWSRAFHVSKVDSIVDAAAATNSLHTVVTQCCHPTPSLLLLLLWWLEHITCAINMRQLHGWSRTRNLACRLCRPRIRRSVVALGAGTAQPCMVVCGRTPDPREHSTTKHEDDVMMCRVS